MFAYTLKRIVVAFLILLVVSGLTFSLSHLSADPALTIAGESRRPMKTSKQSESFMALIDQLSNNISIGCQALYREILEKAITIKPQ